VVRIGEEVYTTAVEKLIYLIYDNYVNYVNLHSEGDAAVSCLVSPSELERPGWGRKDPVGDVQDVTFHWRSLSLSLA